MAGGSEGVVLFDLDGVLVDSRVAVACCLNHALAVHGLPERPAEDLHRFIGPPLSLAFGELIAQRPDSAAVADLVHTYRERYVDASLRDTEVVAGILEALVELEPNHRLAVATSKPLAFAEPLLEAFGLRGYFDVVTGPKLNARTESKATTIAAALDALGSAGGVMVGDRSFDIVGAHEHGLPAIGVTWGIGGRDELASAGADAIVDDPADLAITISRLCEPAS
jgi:phosphoglycolate phosphatase